jgi:Ricin-type beta-trefoil lectin domain-like
MTTFKIVSRSSGKVLDVPGFSTADKTKIEQFTDNGGINQQWQLIVVIP